MAKLTDSQLIVLSKAVAREDGAAVVPTEVKQSRGSQRSDRVSLAVS